MKQREPEIEISHEVFFGLMSVSKKATTLACFVHGVVDRNLSLLCDRGIRSGSLLTFLEIDRATTSLCFLPFLNDDELCLTCLVAITVVILLEP